MLVVRGTRKFLDRVGGTSASADTTSTTALGDWYATMLFWRPQVVLFVNETTLLPVLVPFAPGATVIDRFVAELADAFRAHRLEDGFISAEIAEMSEHRLAKTASRSVTGIMTEFTYLANAYRDGGPVDLHALSLSLATTPCGPLYGRHVSPDRELVARAFAHSGPG